MSTRNPLDELESLLKERTTKRISYLAVFLSAIPSVSEKASNWFSYEAEAVEREIELLEHIVPEETERWKAELNGVRIKFANASKSLENIAKRAEEGEIRSVSEIYERPARGRIPTIVEVEGAEEEGALNVASSLLELWDAASDLEKLINKVEREANRTLRLRRLVRIELKGRSV